MPSGLSALSAAWGTWFEPPQAASPPANSKAMIALLTTPRYVVGRGSSICVLICLSRPACRGCFRRCRCGSARAGNRLVGFPGYGLAVARAGAASRRRCRNRAAARGLLDDRGVGIGGGAVLAAVGRWHGGLLC